MRFEKSTQPEATPPKQGQIDVHALRAATPGCRPDCGIHLHHGGSSLPSARTVSVIVDYLNREARDGPMETAAAAQGELAAARAEAATLVGASSQEIAFTAGGSDAWGVAFAALPALTSTDRILVGQHEWGGNLSMMKMAADRVGAGIEVIPCRANGPAYTPIDLAIRGLSGVARASISYLNTETELQRLVEAVDDLARRGG